MVARIADEPQPIPEPDDDVAVAEALTSVIPTSPDKDVRTQGPVFLNSGAIRVTIEDTEYRLRPPKMKHLKDLRIGLEDLADDLRDLAARTRFDQRSVNKEADTLDEDSETYLERSRELRVESRKRARALMDDMEDLRLGWWSRVWELLCDKPTPDEWPAWMLDNTLPAVFMQHWRTVPLARG